MCRKEIKKKIYNFSGFVLCEMTEHVTADGYFMVEGIRMFGLVAGDLMSYTCRCSIYVSCACK